MKRQQPQWLMPALNTGKAKQRKKYMFSQVQLSKKIHMIIANSVHAQMKKKKRYEQPHTLSH